MEHAEIEENAQLTSRLCGKWAECQKANTYKEWDRMVNWLDGASDGLPATEMAQIKELITVFDLAIEHKYNASH